LFPNSRRLHRGFRKLWEKQRDHRVLRGTLRWRNRLGVVSGMDAALTEFAGVYGEGKPSRKRRKMSQDSVPDGRSTEQSKSRNSIQILFPNEATAA
jgi:hypothetical protein